MCHRIGSWRTCNKSKRIALHNGNNQFCLRQRTWVRSRSIVMIYSHHAPGKKETRRNEMLAEVKQLQLGSLIIYPPILMAPMAGYTDAPFRVMCAQHGAPLCVSEMVIASTIITRTREALELTTFDPRENIRSVQLYGLRSEDVQQAARWLVAERQVQHIDLNFGCPVRKVTSRGGGAAVALQPKLMARLVAAAVRGAGGGVAVTVKLRIGLSDSITTFKEAGRVAEGEGACAVTLHARTADQLYSPPVNWGAIAELAETLQIPVIGNGDVYEAADALRMLRETGARGVMVGRACLGRPWVFSELLDAFHGLPPRPPPLLGGVLQVATRHLQDWSAWHGNERDALLRMRSLVPLYLYGFSSATHLRHQLLTVASVAAWQEAIAAGSHNPLEPFPAVAFRHPRLKGQGGPTKQKVSLPPNWMKLRDSELPCEGALAGACEG